MDDLHEPRQQRERQVAGERRQLQDEHVTAAFIRGVIHSARIHRRSVGGTVFAMNLLPVWGGSWQHAAA